MKWIAVMAYLCCSVSLYAQPTRDKDTLHLNDSIYVLKGSKILLGKGSGTNGQFVYITLARSSFAASTYSMNGDDPRIQLARDRAGYYGTVKDIRSYGTKKMGYKWYLVLSGLSGGPYECDAINAYETKEIILKPGSMVTDSTGTEKKVHKPGKYADQ